MPRHSRAYDNVFIQVAIEDDEPGTFLRDRRPTDRSCLKWRQRRE
jgi:hypothetical protein